MMIAKARQASLTTTTTGIISDDEGAQALADPSRHESRAQKRDRR
jgi:hypothetical protein